MPSARTVPKELSFVKHDVHLQLRPVPSCRTYGVALIYTFGQRMCQGHPACAGVGCPPCALQPGAVIPTCTSASDVSTPSRCTRSNSASRMAAVTASDSLKPSSSLTATSAHPTPALPARRLGHCLAKAAWLPHNAHLTAIQVCSVVILRQVECSQGARCWRSF